MTSDRSPSTSTPLPLFPMEVKSNIIRFCDSSTLGRVSQVCLAFLQIASPLLYEDVVLKGPEALESFFCERPSSTHPAHLEPFLSLSQTRSITFFPDGLITRELHLYKDRFSAKLLPLDALTLRPKAFETRDIERMWTSFLSLLCPLRVYVIGIRDDFSRPYALVPSVALHEEPLEWKRVELIEFTNASGLSFLGSSSFLIGREAGGSASPLQIIYNSHQQWEDHPDGQPVDRLLLYDLSWLVNSITEPDDGCPIFAFPFVKVVVRVRSEEEGSEIMSDVEDGWDVMELGNGEKREWRRRLKIEVVEMEEDGDEDDEGSLDSEIYG